MFKLFLMFNVAIGLKCLAMPPKKSCQDMPRVKAPNIKTYIEAGTFTYYLSTPMLFCATETIVYPKLGSTGYNASAILIIGNTENSYDFAVAADRETIHTTKCNDGGRMSWYFADSYFSPTGSYYAVYACNGTALLEYGWASNNETLAKQKNVGADLVANVEGGERVSSARVNCTKHPYCHLFD